MKHIQANSPLGRWRRTGARGKGRIVACRGVFSPIPAQGSNWNIVVHLLRYSRYLDTQCVPSMGQKPGYDTFCFSAICPFCAASGIAFQKPVQPTGGRGGSSIFCSFLYPSIPTWPMREPGGSGKQRSTL